MKNGLILVEGLRQVEANHFSSLGSVHECGVLVLASGVSVCVCVCERARVCGSARLGSALLLHMGECVAFFFFEFFELVAKYA